MTNKQILQADMLDILFEHRNKLYGAYALRKTYSSRLMIALGSALALVFSFLLMSIIKNKNDDGNNRNIKDEMFVVTTYNLPEEKPKEPEPKIEEKKPAKATSDYQPIIVVPDNKADTMLATMYDIENSEIGNKNQAGEKPDDLAKAKTDSKQGGSGNNTVFEEKEQTVLPSRQPEFPGGTAAWLAFLQRYLQSPDGLEPGQRVEVQVRFWVDVDGSVSRPEIIKSGGSSFDKEVLRVMKKMPRWQPALQNGNLIAVSYTQPVIFISVEE
jgi:periplasmic protein TonB